MLFCQLDVTGRYGKDPVATLLIQRMVSQYGLQEGAPLPTAMAVVGEPGRGLLSLLGVPTEDFRSLSMDQLDRSRPLILDLRKREALTEEETLRVQRFVATGGRLLQIGASSKADKAWLPGEMRFRWQQIFRTEVPDYPLLSGLGNSDFFWRLPHQVPAIAAVPPRGKLLNSGAMAVIPFGQGVSVFCQFDPLSFKAAWQRTKALRILSTVLTNLRARSTVIPRHSEGASQDVLGPYIENALDFDPDEYCLFGL